MDVPLVDLRAQYQPLKDNILRRVEEILDGMFLFLGPNVQAFEQEFADYHEVGHAVGVSDGTTALQLALMACGVGAGDEVITVPHTFIATAEAIALVGAKPVFDKGASEGRPRHKRIPWSVLPVVRRESPSAKAALGAHRARHRPPLFCTEITSLLHWVQSCALGSG